MLSFLLLYLIPGDVVDILMGQESGDPARLAEMRRLFGIDRPLPVAVRRVAAGRRCGEISAARS